MRLIRSCNVGLMAYRPFADPTATVRHPQTGPSSMLRKQQRVSPRTGSDVAGDQPCF